MAIDFSIDANGVALVTINRPEKLNALDGEHYRALSEAWIRVRDDPAVRVAVVTGTGDRAFSVGADVKWLASQSRQEIEWNTQREPLLNRGLEIWKPVICAVRGYCLGAGLTLALATDIRIAAHDSVFGFPEVKRGAIAGNGGTQRLAQQVPYAVAMEMLLSGDHFSAQTAARWGLVNHIVGFDEVLPVAMELAGRIALNAPLAVQATKELSIRGRGMDLATGLRLEALAVRLLRETADANEGALAFSEKRAPVFRGK